MVEIYCSSSSSNAVRSVEEGIKMSLKKGKKKQIRKFTPPKTDDKVVDA